MSQSGPPGIGPRLPHNNFKKSQTKTRILTRIVEVLSKTHAPLPRITSTAMPFNVAQQRDTDHDEEV
jgi:hypothetical protein